MAAPQMGLRQQSCSLQFRGIFRAGGSPRRHKSVAHCRATEHGRQACRPACDEQPDAQIDTASAFSRRDALFMAAGVPLLQLGLAAPAFADALQLTTYRDGPDEFEVDIPEGWSNGTGQAEGGKGFTGSTGARRAVAWYPEGEISNVNVSVVVTNVGADYTKLGSFGTASAFGENLVASMDRRYLLRSSWNRKGRSEQIQEAELLAAREGRKGNNQLYYIDYSLLKPGEDERRVFMTAVALGFNGRYNRLYTMTAQCLQKDLPRVGDSLQKVVASFTPPSPVI